MSNKKKRINQNNNGKILNNSSQGIQGDLLKITAVHSQAIETATEEDLQVVQPLPTPASINLTECWKIANEARQLFESQAKRTKSESDKAEATRKQLESEKNKVITLREELETQQQELDEKQKKLDRQQATLNARETELLEKERELSERELNAEAGFAAQNRNSLAQLEAEARILREELSQIRRTISEERVKSLQELETELIQKGAEAEEELERKYREFQETLCAERQELEEEKQRTVSAQKQLRRQQERLEVDRELFEEDKQALKEKVGRKAAARVEELQAEVSATHEKLEQARTERDRLQSILIQREEADRKFGHKTPEQVLEEIKTIQREKQELERKLAMRPSEDAAERLGELELQREAWETERSQLKREMQQLKHNLTNTRIEVTALEDLRNEKEALLASKSLLQTALDELKAQVQDLTSKVEGKSAFPACSAMDSDRGMQAEVPLLEEIPSLKEFAEDLRYRIAWNPQTGKQLYYSARDIRAFLGGLAMSRLHILQGISGTGKTSLPLAFARALGGNATLLEVQAGWRDRQDLIGHFNAFEGRFYESEFLQAIYKAQCPAYQNRIYLILLDEMNLSRPEQYFADFLSKLEQDTPVLELMTAPVEPAPQLLQEGRKLSIPPNVWFVGTANHDETTLEFADKTYDRSHIMELPRNRENFEIPQIEHRDPVSYQALNIAFEKAKDNYAREASKAYNFLHEIEDTLDKCFQVGWGNRLQRQMQNFVPVVIASGGTIGEATDHILATKILRKIRDRYDTQPDDLRKLQEDIRLGWSELETGTEPELSLAIIREELRRLGEADI